MLATDISLAAVLRWARRRVRERRLRLEGERTLDRPSAATYAVLSRDPVVIHAFYRVQDHRRMWFPLEALNPLFLRLAGRRATFLFLFGWDFDTPRAIAGMVEVRRRYLRRFPEIRFVYLCPTERHTERCRAAGLEAVWCQHNALLDARLFTPDPNVPKRFDAVYNAKLRAFKRHALAASVDRLALITYDVAAAEDAEYARTVARCLAHAHWVNAPDPGAHRWISETEVLEVLRASRVGLCLSAVEGGMYASAEYLLCGLPVVSTRSRGGRGEFFDPEYVAIVDDTPEAVAEGVRAMIARDPDPDVIRARTLERMGPHRERFIAAVQGAYDEAGCGRRFAEEWPRVFFNKLIRVQEPLDERAAPWESPGHGS